MLGFGTTSFITRLPDAFPVPPAGAAVNVYQDIAFPRSRACVLPLLHRLPLFRQTFALLPVPLLAAATWLLRTAVRAF